MSSWRRRKSRISPAPSAAATGASTLAGWPSSLRTTGLRLAPGDLFTNHVRFKVKRHGLKVFEESPQALPGLQFH
jgi:hypothetical protein